MGFIVDNWNFISMVGVSEEISASNLKRIKLTNRFGVIALFFTLPYIFGFFYFGYNNLGYLLCFLSCIYLSTLYFNHLKLYNIAKSILYLTVLVHQFIVSSVFGELAEVHIMYMALLLLPIVLCDHKKDAWWIFFYVLITVIAIAVLYLTNFSLFAINVSDSFVRILNIAYKISTLAGVIVILSATTVVADKTEKILDEDKLLLENRLAVIFDNSFDAIFLVDAKSKKIIKANKRAAELFEMKTADDFYGIVGISFHKETPSQEFIKQMQFTLLSTGIYESEIHYKTEKGNDFWGALAIRMININDKAYQSVRVTDITSHKKAEKQIQASLNEKELLLEEIHHRVKNNLAVISGLLSLQAAYLEDEQAQKMFEESRSRIHSMALIHDKLYQHETHAKINFGSYINDLIDHIKKSYSIIDTDIRFLVTCNDIFLDIKNAMPCGLIINELISNSYKHAFKGKKEGEVKIVCTLMSEKFTLMVSDNGVGYDVEGDIKDPQSLGITLIKALVGQLSGQLTTTCKDGTAYYVSFDL